MIAQPKHGGGSACGGGGGSLLLLLGRGVLQLTAQRDERVQAQLEVCVARVQPPPHERGARDARITRTLLYATIRQR